MKKRNLLHIALAMVLMLTAISALSAQNGELLLNPGFEPPFVALPSDIGAVAQGWNMWSVDDTQLAEYYAASNTTNGVGTPQIRSESDAQQYFSFFTPHAGGVYQQVSGVTPGAEVQFSVFAYVLSSAEAEPVISSPDADMIVQVGIDPTGGTDGTSDDIVWSDPDVTYDAYEQYTVSATAEDDTISVWVRSIVNNPLQFNIVYLDDAALFVTDGEAAAATEEPTEEVLTPPTLDITEATEVIIIPEETVQIITPVIEPSPEVEVTLELTVLPLETFETTEVPTATEEATVEVIIEPPDVVVIIPLETEEVTEEPTELPTQVPTEVPTDEPTATPTIEPTTPAPTATTEPPTITPTETGEIVVLTPTFTPSPSPTLNTTLFPLAFTYTVQSGDNLSALALRFGSTVEGIQIANQLAPDAIIFVGQPLIIPVQTLPETPAATSTPEATLPPTATATLEQPTATPIPTEPTAVIGELVVPPSATPFVYIVRYGDTLSSIAARFGTTTRALARLNGIVNPNLVYVGQALRIAPPSPTATPVYSTGTPTNVPPTATPTRIPPTPTQVARVYVVQPGDTLYFISLRLNVPIRALIELNRIVDANRIYVGQALLLP